MALVIPPGFAQIEVEMRNSGDPDPWYWTFGLDGSELGGDWSLAATRVASGLDTYIAADFSTSTSVTAVIVKAGQDGGPPLVARFEGDIGGGASSAKLPQNCALLVSKPTGRAGRAGRGRMFIPNYLSESAVDNVGVIDNTAYNSYVTAWNDFYEYVEGSDTGFPTPVVLLHNAGVPGGTTPDHVLGFVPQRVIATQRRRLR